MGLRIFAFCVLILSTSALAQTPSAEDVKVVVDEQAQDMGDLLNDVVEAGCIGKCCPPSTGDKVIMGVASVAVFLILFFLMVRLMERVFIKQEKSPLAGRHLGVSFALFLGGAAMMGIFFLVTGCFWPSYFYFLGVVGAIWLLHLIYTLLVIRR